MRRAGERARARRDLNLKRPIYQATAENGHFGHDQFPWEQAKTLKIDKDTETKISKIKNGEIQRISSNTLLAH